MRAEQPTLSIELQRLLLLDWFSALAEEGGLQLDGHRSNDGKSFRLGSPTGRHVIAKVIEEPPYLRFGAGDPGDQDAVHEIASRAETRVQDSNLGGIVWYSTELHETEFRFSPFSLMSGLLQRMHGQVRIKGWRRIGPNVLLEFQEATSDGGDKQQLFAPRAIVHVHIAAPGPGPGELSLYIATDALETVATISGFALGRPLDLPHHIFPTEDEGVSGLDQRRLDPEIATLARRGISLDIFSPLAFDYGFDLAKRVQAALISFDSASRQERDAVACVLYAVSAESLSVPHASWRRERLTQRFVAFLDELLAEDLDQTVAHANFEEAFGIRRGRRTARALRRELLSRVYNYRSGQVHEGLEPGYRGMLLGFERFSAVRRGLIANLAETAILRYLAAPRCSLVGHPSVHP